MRVILVWVSPLRLSISSFISPGSTILAKSCISMGSNEHPVWRSHGEEAKRGEAGGQFILWDCEVIGAFLLPWAPPRCPGSRAGACAVQRLGGRRGRRP